MAAGPVTDSRNPLRLLGAAEAAELLGVGEPDTVALMDRGELAEFRLPTERLGKRYTSRLAIGTYQRCVIDDTYGQAAPVLVGQRRTGRAAARSSPHQ